MIRSDASLRDWRYDVLDLVSLHVHVSPKVGACALVIELWERKSPLLLLSYST